MKKSDLIAVATGVALIVVASGASAQMLNCVTRNGITSCDNGQSYMGTGGGFSQSLNGDGSVIQNLGGETAGIVTSPYPRESDRSYGSERPYSSDRPYGLDK